MGRTISGGSLKNSGGWLLEVSLFLLSNSMVWTLLEVESESDLIDDDADSVIDVGIELNDSRLGLDDRDFSDEYVVDNDVNETEFRLYLNDLSLIPFLLDSLD
jgi:hypothetical protein